MNECIQGKESSDLASSESEWKRWGRLVAAWLKVEPVVWGGVTRTWGQDSQVPESSD